MLTPGKMGADVLVIGGGHNGLVAALRLARAGRRVTVLEAGETLGGLAAPLELAPGFTVPGLLPDRGLVRRSLVDDLGLAEHGLRLAPAPPLLIAAPGSPLFRIEAEAEKTAAGLPDDDRDGYLQWRSYLAAVAPVVRRLTAQVPPPLVPPRLVPVQRGRGQLGELLALAGSGLAVRRLGRERMLELLRVVPMPAADWLREAIASPALAEGLALPGVAGAFAGPHSAGTAGNLLLAECGALDREAADGTRIVGGGAALVAALAAACRQAGVTLRTGCAVERLLVDGGDRAEREGTGGAPTGGPRLPAPTRVRGVRLAGGEEIEATTVLASCAPAALHQLIPPGVLPLTAEDQLAAVRARGIEAVLLLALSGPLELAGASGGQVAAARIGGGHLDELERAYDAVKYGEIAPRPHLEIEVPSALDPSLAPAGSHVALVTVRFAPEHPGRAAIGAGLAGSGLAGSGLAESDEGDEQSGGWGGGERAQLEEAALAALEEAAPGSRGKITARRLFTPVDLARDYRLPGGHLHHAEHALDQLLMMRPAPSFGRYATPLAGLFLAGAGCHPGGGMSGLPGWLGAGAVLAAGGR